MDFFKPFERALERFDEIRGVLFLDPDGESILHFTPRMEAYNLRFVGATTAVLIKNLLTLQPYRNLRTLEWSGNHCHVLFLPLANAYAVTVIVGPTEQFGRLRNYFFQLASMVNGELM
jgi:hypothetical protein